MNAEIQSYNEQTPITAQTVKDYICPIATDQELFMFVEMCRARKLNPFLKQAYLIKYSSTSPASMVVSKDVFLDRANKIPEYSGFSAGIILISTSGDLVRTEGLIYPNHTIIGGWAKVYREGREPLSIEVNFNEYCGRKKDGELSGQWISKPSTMIRKVALVQALRESFPEEFEGMYDESELPAMQMSAEQSTQTITQPKKLDGSKLKSAEGPQPFCVSCGIELLPDVYKWSMDKHKTPLCREHQRQFSGAGKGGPRHE